MIIEIIASLLGTIGYALMVRMKRNQVITAGIGGGIAWAIYILVSHHTESVFVCAMAASMFIGIFAEVMARFHKAPTTIFLTCCAIPLIPGGRVYYFISGILTKDMELAKLSGNMALGMVLGIAIGFLVISIIYKYIRMIMAVVKSKNA